MSAPASTPIARLRWQCRRGMRELDLLLVRYLDSEYPTASTADQQGFERLVTLTDPELLGYLLHGERPADQELAHVIERVRNLGP